MTSQQELQAVVLAAGRGSRLPEVLKDTPKCLLPVGPYPLIWYTLNLLQRHNFQDALVVVVEKEKCEIQQALEHTLKIKLEFVCVPEEDLGTADSLRHIHDRIKTDFIVLSCDVVTNVSLYPLINKFRQHEAALTALLFKSGFESDVSLPGPKTKYKAERDLIGIHPDTQRLLLLASISDFEDVVNVSGHLMRKYEKMQIFSRLVDSHIYIMKRWTLDILLKKEHLSTLKGEFLPYIIKKQMMKLGGSAVTASSQDAQLEFGATNKCDNDVFSRIRPTKLDEQIQQKTLFNDSLNNEPYMGDIIRCYAVQAPKDTFGVRINTTLSFFAINRKLTELWQELCGDQLVTENGSIISKNAVVNCTQSKEISVGDGAKLCEKTSLNFSNFGPLCHIHPKNIISKSVLLTNATVEEGCNIDNCIIGCRAVVKKGSVLKNCLIGPGYIVEEGSKLENKHLTNSDGFMEIDIQ